MRNKWVQKLFLRRMFVALLLLAQIGFLVFIMTRGGKVASVITASMELLSVFIVLYIVSKKEKPAYKLVWVVLVLAVPVFGALLYLIIKFQTSRRIMTRRIGEIENNTRPCMAMGNDCLKQACADCASYVRDMQYLQEYTQFPVCAQTTTQYYSPGEKMMPLLLADLEKAEHYIFMEYFIMQEGKLWNSVLEILERKAKQGVEVRVMFDDMGCFLTLPADYAQQLEAKGIKARVFNPFVPVLSSIQNNRDHRKITSVDGKIAHTGGINMADEYINEFEKHGYWKDSGIRLEGDAAWSLTVIFMQLWNLGLPKDAQDDVEEYFPWKEQPCTQPHDGYVIPYADSPMDREDISEHVYLQIINQAHKTLYITTPYFIVDDNILSALRLAAKSGVDVRIITPAHWDKRLVHITTRSFYHDLVEAGVKVYEYTPGFIHSKVFVADGKVATVGTINLDFRSLYLHFECGVWMCGSTAVAQAEQDFLETLNVCKPILLEDCRKINGHPLVQEVLRVFAPLL